jgi:hypothetical protein
MADTFVPPGSLFASKTEAHMRPPVVDEPFHSARDIA